MNPAASVKDRIAISMIEVAEQSGLIQPNITTIIEATSGNTGIGLAMVCAAKGYSLMLTMPEDMSQERQQILRAYRAKVVLTPAKADMEGAIARANELLSSLANAFSPQQFSNPANPQIHYKTTGPEIWQDTGEAVDVLGAVSLPNGREFSVVFQRGRLSMLPLKLASEQSIKVT